jgi:hypothetical protein
MQVGPADPGVPTRQKHLSRWDLRIGKHLDPKVASTVNTDCAHHTLLTSAQIGGLLGDGL